MFAKTQPTTGPVSGVDLPCDYNRVQLSTDETTVAVKLDPYQQHQSYPHSQHNLQHSQHPFYLPPPAVQRPTITTTTLQPSNSSSVPGQHYSSSSASGRLDLRNLLLAPPAASAARGLRDGRGSISAPATPVDDSSSLAAAAVATAVVPLNFSVSSSGSSGGKSSGGGGIGKFMMKKVNSAGGGVGSAQSDCVLRDLIHPAHADALKAHSALAIKLLKTGTVLAPNI